jgi:raffinose/stachyose/melibiose transport system substrate-binding protein
MSAPLSRRGFLQLTGAAGAAVAGSSLLSACSGSSAGSTAGQTNFWYAFSDTKTQKYFQQNFIDAYNNTKPPAKAVMSLKQVSTLDQLTQTAVASGKGPDIISTSSPAAALNYVHTGNLLALDAYVDKLGWTQTFLPWALNAGRVGGKLYSVPSSYETMAIFYNPATFAEHGWTPPTSRAEFEAICADAAAKGIMPVGAGNSDWQAATEWHVTWMWNTYAGPQALYEALTGKRKWTDPVFVDAISTLKGWFDKGWFGGGTNNYFTNKFATLYQKLASGKSAMQFSGSWSFTEIPPYFGSAAGNNATWDWAPLPSMNTGVPAGVFPLSIGNSLSINKTCKNPDAAADFLNYITTDASRQLDALAAVGQEPTPIKLTAGEFPASVDSRMKRQYLDLATATNVGYTTWTFWPAKTDTYIATDINKVLTGQLSPQAFCAGVDSQFQAEFKAGTVPPIPAPTGA